MLCLWEKYVLHSNLEHWEASPFCEGMGRHPQVWRTDTPAAEASPIHSLKLTANGAPAKALVTGAQAEGRG